MLLSPAGRESKTICLPSGDQRGEPVWLPPKVVNCTGLRPSLSHTQISRLALRSDTKATRVPSGENCGLDSSRVEPTSGLGSLAGAIESGPGARQRLVSVLR